MGQQLPIRVREQEKLDENDWEYVKGLGLSWDTSFDEKMPPYLGISAEGWSSYYVGAVWLRPSEREHGQSEPRPLVVTPKFDDIDFIRLFSKAFDDDIPINYFEKSYDIYFEEPPIEENTLNTILSPLIVAHYLSTVKRLLKRGLKKSYIIREENLTNKVRGHILPLPNLQRNILHGHPERAMCRFQEYSADYPENKLLKRALLASENLLLSIGAGNNSLLRNIRKALSRFEGISSDITLSEIKTVHRDKLHGEYPVAIKLAKMILRHADLSISTDNTKKQRVPAFSIDMSRIFEFHVLSLLKDYLHGETVKFQEDADIMGRCDYIIPSMHLIVDAKYKRDYPTRENDVIRADVREVTGYSRSKKIRKILQVENDKVVPCLIVYPDDNSHKEKIQDNDLLKTPLKDVIGVYVLGVAYPKLT